jgi:hypothetical protein
MFDILTYRRPEYVARASTVSLSESEKESIIRSSSKELPQGIPEALSFDNILNGSVRPVSYNELVLYIDSLMLISNPALYCP